VATQTPGDIRVGAGPPLFCTRIAIAADGEILVSGPTVSPRSGPVLASGDLGALEADGSLRVIGRKADTIITGGENVAPSEVEAALAAHPSVVEAAVFGIADAQWGEEVRALVVVRGAVTEDELRRHCARRLAAFKVPKRIGFVASLPRTASGKVQRRLLAVDGGEVRT
jgi:O-succinylbenzoic acid--CoA ligase